MATYSMNLRDVKNLTVKAFWMLSRNVDRIAAEHDYRQVAVVSAAMSGGDGFTEMVDQLKEQIGMTVEFAPAVAEDVSQDELKGIVHEQLDVDGLNSLRSLGSLGGAF